MVDYPILIHDPLDDELNLWLCPYFYLWRFPDSMRWHWDQYEPRLGILDMRLASRWQVVAQGAEEVRRWLDAHAGSAGSVDGAPSTASTA